MGEEVPLMLELDDRMLVRPATRRGFIHDHPRKPERAHKTYLKLQPQSRNLFRRLYLWLEPVEEAFSVSVDTIWSAHAA